MSKSAIYTVNNSTQNVAINGTLNLGTIIRRFGPNINLLGNAIQLQGPGYYKINASITASPETAGEVIITVYKNGEVIPGAVATETAAEADDYVNLSITSIVKEFCKCCDNISNITFVLTGTASEVTNVAITFEKL